MLEAKTIVTGSKLDKSNTDQTMAFQSQQRNQANNHDLSIVKQASNPELQKSKQAGIFRDSFSPEELMSPDESSLFGKGMHNVPRFFNLNRNNGMPSSQEDS